MRCSFIHLQEGIMEAARTTVTLGSTNVNGFMHWANSSRRLSLSHKSPHNLHNLSLRAQPNDDEYVSYESGQSVFPAEACEELGGDSCLPEGIGPEVKPKPVSPKPTAQPQPNLPDREYQAYADDKTVFPGEACDELGGEFCEPDYQKGVFPEKAAVK